MVVKAGIRRVELWWRGLGLQAGSGSFYSQCLGPS